MINTYFATFNKWSLFEQSTKLLTAHDEGNNLS